MKKLLNKPWFAGLLALVACGFVIQALLPERRAAANPVTEVTAAPEPEMPGDPDEARAPISIASALSALAASPATRDPFAPRIKHQAAKITADKPEPDIIEIVRLSALWSQGSETLLLLNGRIVQVGAEIGRLKVESATQDGIWLSHWKGRDFLALGAEFALITPATGPAPTALAASSH